jgi:polysaccharide biosynthesis/export protein
MLSLPASIEVMIAKRGSQMKKVLFDLIFLFCILVLVSESVNLQAQGSAVPYPDIKTAGVGGEQPSIGEDYVIGVEDVLSIYVWKEPDLSVRELVVRPDGKISIPLISDIQAGGFTPKQLKQTITERIKEFVAAPNVTVTVIKSLSRSVSVVGQVNRPGTYQLSSPITVLELLARAGGITEFAKSKDIKVVRKENGKTLQFAFNYKDAIKGMNLQQNIVLKIGDVVLVP